MYWPFMLLPWHEWFFLPIIFSDGLPPCPAKPSFSAIAASPYTAHRAAGQTALPFTPICPRTKPRRWPICSPRMPYCWWRWTSRIGKRISALGLRPKSLKAAPISVASPMLIWARSRTKSCPPPKPPPASRPNGAAWPAIRSPACSACMPLTKPIFSAAPPACPARCGLTAWPTFCSTPRPRCPSALISQ